jgi:hypothetical protein
LGMLLMLPELGPTEKDVSSVLRTRKSAAAELSRHSVQRCARGAAVGSVRELLGGNCPGFAMKQPECDREED